MATKNSLRQLCAERVWFRLRPYCCRSAPPPGPPEQVECDAVCFENRISEAREPLQFHQLLC